MHKKEGMILESSVLLKLFQDEREKANDREEHLFTNANALEYTESAERQEKDRVIFDLIT